MPEYTVVIADFAMKGKVRTVTQGEDQQATGMVPTGLTKWHGLRQQTLEGLGGTVPFVGRVRSGT